MSEIFSLIDKILFIPIPFPLTFGNIIYYNLFGLIVVAFIIFLAGLILKKLLAGSSDD